MERFVPIEATTTLLRNEAIRRTLELLGAEGGFITSTTELGGLALTLAFELPSSAAATLAERAERAGIALDARYRGELERAALSGADVVGSLSLRFLAGEPDLRIVVPKVP